jgi:hypothetical protein
LLPLLLRRQALPPPLLVVSMSAPARLQHPLSIFPLPPLLRRLLPVLSLCGHGENRRGQKHPCKQRHRHLPAMCFLGFHLKNPS